MGLVDEAAGRPLILTLALDIASQQFFNTQRDRFFPPAINYLQAHVTLFHHLPSSQLAQIKNNLEQAISGHETFPIVVTGLRNLGRGVAYVLESLVLITLRAQLAEKWANFLTAQDRQKFNPHVTIQNKVTPEEARSTRALLENLYRPTNIQACGLHLWRYEGGPWQHIQTYKLIQPG